jgi:hypothetical protein
MKKVDNDAVDSLIKACSSLKCYCKRRLHGFRRVNTKGRDYSQTEYGKNAWVVGVREKILI